MNLFFFFSVPLTAAAAAVLVANSSDIKEVKKAFDAAHVRIIIKDLGRQSESHEVFVLPRFRQTFTSPSTRRRCLE